MEIKWLLFTFAISFLPSKEQLLLGFRNRFPGFRSSYSPRLPIHPFRQWLVAAFVPITVAGRRENFTPFPNSGAMLLLKDLHSRIMMIQKKSPDPAHCGLIRGCRFSSSITYWLRRPFHGAQSKHTLIQVFRLPDRSTGRAFPSFRTVAICGFRPRLRRRVRDGFQPSSLNSLKNQKSKIQICQREVKSFSIPT
jgi:hypothetical protein